MIDIVLQDSVVWCGTGSCWSINLVHIPSNTKCRVKLMAKKWAAKSASEDFFEYQQVRMKTCLVLVLQPASHCPVSVWLWLVENCHQHFDWPLLITLMKVVWPKHWTTSCVMVQRVSEDRFFKHLINHLGYIEVNSSKDAVHILHRLLAHIWQRMLWFNCCDLKLLSE